VKYARTPEFRADYARLSATERDLFKQAVRQMNAAYAARGERALPPWPASLRVKSVQDASGVWEMTWSFSGPDGRATVEYIAVDGETAILWRRIGGHRIFDNP
jgi:hypothetical protein